MVNVVLRNLFYSCAFIFGFYCIKFFLFSNHFYLFTSSLFCKVAVFVRQRISHIGKDNINFDSIKSGKISFYKWKVCNCITVFLYLNYVFLMLFNLTLKCQNRSLNFWSYLSIVTTSYMTWIWFKEILFSQEMKPQLLQVAFAFCLKLLMPGRWHYCHTAYINVEVLSVQTCQMMTCLESQDTNSNCRRKSIFSPKDNLSDAWYFNCSSSTELHNVKTIFF